MKKQTRRKILGILATLPVSSTAFAYGAQFVTGFDSIKPKNLDYEGEMMRRLDEGTLSAKYYDFLDRHDVKSVQSLYEPQYSRHKSRLIKEFISDLYNPEDSVIMASSSMSAIPPK